MKSALARTVIARRSDACAQEITVSFGDALPHSLARWAAVVEREL